MRMDEDDIRENSIFQTDLFVLALYMPTGAISVALSEAELTGLSFCTSEEETAPGISPSPGSARKKSTPGAFEDLTHDEIQRK